MLKPSIYRLMGIICLIMHFSFMKSVFATERDVNFQFKDPIASYNGQNISRQKFLDFIQESTGLAEKNFSEASTDLIQEYIGSYVLYEELFKKIKEDPIYESQQVQEALGILSNYVLAGLYEEMEDITEREMPEFVEDIKVDGGLQLASLLLISQNEGIPQPESRLKEDPNLQDELANIYQEVLVKAYLGNQQGLKERSEYQKRYDWAIKNYLSNLYIKRYLESIFNQNEIDKMFDQWLSEQKFFEYKGAHIYVSEEVVAQNILDKLKNQEITFEEAVVLYSEDLASNEYDGRLGRGGWVSFPQEEHPFSRAIISMDEGSISETVIKGIAGYHIIRLDEKRVFEGPSYIYDEAYKLELWENNKTRKFLQNFKNTLEITY